MPSGHSLPHSKSVKDLKGMRFAELLATNCYPLLLCKHTPSAPLKWQPRSLAGIQGLTSAAVPR